MLIKAKTPKCFSVREQSKITDTRERSDKPAYSLRGGQNTSECCPNWVPDGGEGSKEGSGAQTLGSKPNISGVLSTMTNPNPALVMSRSDPAAREQQKHDFSPKDDLLSRSP